MGALNNVTLKDGMDNEIYPITPKPVSATVTEYVNAFMRKVNEKAKFLGMNNSYFIAPAGDSNANQTTAYDLMKLVLGCTKYDDFMNIWSTKSKKVYTKNELPKEVSLSTTVSDAVFEDYYTILGGKTGSGFGEGSTLIIIGVCEDKLLAGAVIASTSTPTNSRFYAMKELFDIASKKLKGESIEGMTVTYAKCACVCEIPTYPYLYMSNENELNILYQQEQDYQTAPSSATKTITCITALDYIDDLDETVEMLESDMVGGSGRVFEAGDIVSYRDLLYAAMLPSSNMSAHALAANLGKKILQMEQDYIG